MRGFLGTAAPLASDVTLLLEVGMGVSLAAGAWLARKGRYRAHAWCQCAVVLLNLPVICGFMAPSFRRQVEPLLPGGVSGWYTALAVAHAVTGGLAETFGVYILLAAGTNFLPKWLRFVRYKPWMRAALLLWWLTVLLGVGTYVRWYAVPLWSGVVEGGPTVGRCIPPLTIVSAHGNIGLAVEYMARSSKVYATRSPIQFRKVAR